MRIGYFGGTFDPPHRAHLRVAQAAADAYKLDRVLLAPTGHQPLKDHEAYASYDDRLAMTRLLCADDPQLEVSEIDAPHADGSPNFTVQALQALRQLEPNAELFVIAGADSFLTLRSWRDSEELLQMADWIVAARPEASLDDLSALALTEEERKRVHLLTSVDEDVSATGIRERLRVGVSCDKLLTPTVNLYIARMHLYHAR
jgi:nicotinate-nucleotide adenylyltransferase